MERSILAIELCQVSWHPQSIQGIDGFTPHTGLSFLVGHIDSSSRASCSSASRGLGVSGKTSDEVVQAVEKLDRSTGNSWSS